MSWGRPLHAVLGGWFTPRLLALHALAVVALAVCTLMGLWQLGVYGSKHDDAAKVVRAAAPVDLLKVWGPDDPFTADLGGQRVRIHKRGSASEPFEVRRPDGAVWLAATVPVKGTKSAIVVVIGHVPVDAIDYYVPQLPPSFTAILQPAEPTGELSMAHRVNVVEGDLFSGYALLDLPRQAQVLKPVAPPNPDVSWTVGLRNLAYALQWWVFGLFAVFMWWRMATEAVDVEAGVEDARIP